MTIAPTVFSSNVSDEISQERKQRIFNDDCNPEQLLIRNESSIFDNSKVIIINNEIKDSSSESDTEKTKNLMLDTKRAIPNSKYTESNSESDDTDNEKTKNLILDAKRAISNVQYHASTFKNASRKHLSENINDIALLSKNKIKRQENKKNVDENSLKIERIKHIIQQEQNVANLKLQHQEAIQKLELDYLKEKYALEIRAATAATELSEFLLKEKVN